MDNLQTLLAKVQAQFEDLMNEQKQQFAEELERERVRMVSELQERENKFNEVKKRLEAEKGQISDIQIKSTTRVKLDVGGQIFHTSVSTLSSQPDSMLSAMFSGRYSLNKSEDGSIFIDRNGTYFGFVLDWLRTGHLPKLSYDCKLNLLEEARYYSLDALIAILEDEIENNKDANRITQKEFIKLVMKTDTRKPLYLVGCDLRDVHLAYQSLTNALLDGANLKGMNLEYVNLSGASLQNANLQNANLKGANLENAILVNANLKDANLTGANLGKADLSNANLSCVSLSSANLTSANFSEANLSNANLSSVSLAGAKFNNANLENADFSNAGGGHATFTGAKGKPKRIAVGM